MTSVEFHRYIGRGLASTIWVFMPFSTCVRRQIQTSQFLRNHEMKKERSRKKKNILLEPVLTADSSKGDAISPGQDIFNYFSRTIIQIYLYDHTVNTAGPRCYLSRNQR